MVSFAGGLPSEDAFPDVGRFPVPQRKLQYDPTEGEPELRARVADDLRRRGLKCTARQVLILSGSQQEIDLVAKLFIDPATLVAVESPTYLATLQVFKFYGACLNAFESSDQAKLRAAIKGRAFAYVTPKFQNSTGRCYSKAEREALSYVCDSTLTRCSKTFRIATLTMITVRQISSAHRSNARHGFTRVRFKNR